MSNNDYIPNMYLYALITAISVIIIFITIVLTISYVKLSYLTSSKKGYADSVFHKIYYRMQFSYITNYSDSKILADASKIIFHNEKIAMILGIMSNDNDQVYYMNIPDISIKGRIYNMLPTININAQEMRYHNYIGYKKSFLSKRQIDDKKTVYMISSYTNHEHVPYYYILMTAVIFCIILLTLRAIMGHYEYYISIMYQAITNKSKVFSGIKDPYCIAINQIKDTQNHMSEEVSRSIDDIMQISQNENI